MLNHFYVFLLNLWKERLGDTSEEFPQHEGIDPHASVLYPRASLDALPCPTCGHRIAAEHFNVHADWCAVETDDPIYQRPDDRELDY